MQAPSENPKFWGTPLEAQEDKFYQGLNSLYFDEASPVQKQEWLNFHFQRMLNDVDAGKHFQSKDDAIYTFNAFIILYWDGLIRPNRPEMPLLPYTTITESRYINRARVIYLLNSIDFDTANPELKQKMAIMASDWLGFTPSKFNLNLPYYWNPRLRPNRPPPPYLRPEITLNGHRITGNIEEDVNSQDYDLATPEEINQFLTYNIRLTSLSIPKFNSYIEHIWVPHRNRRPLNLLLPRERRRPTITFMKYPWPRDSVLEDVEIYGRIEDALEPCPVDEDGEVTDIVDMTPIPPNQLVRIRTGGVLHCYNLDTLIKINNDTGIDPLTRIPFARDLRKDIFKLELAKRGLVEIPETVDFRHYTESLFQDFEGLLNDTPAIYSDIIDRYRRSLNELRGIVRSAIIVTLSKNGFNLVEEMIETQTIEDMLGEIRNGFLQQTNQ